MCDDCKEMPEELARLLLPIYQERSNQLANIIHASNGLIVTILIGVLTFAGTITNITSYHIAFIVSICVLSLIIWRVYVHFVDSDIIHMYGKILCCEYRLLVPSRVSLLSSLIKQLPAGQTKSELENLVALRKTREAYSKMFVIIDGKNVGSRGHEKIDEITGGAILSFIVFGSIVAFISISDCISQIFASFIFGFLWAFVIILIAIYPDFNRAKNPD